MEIQLFDGDYVRSGSGVKELGGTDEMLERIAFRLKARRGGFALLPEFGSRLYELARIKKSERRLAAEQFIRQAMADETDVDIRSIRVEEEAGVMKIDLELICDGGEYSMQVEV